MIFLKLVKILSLYAAIGLVVSYLADRFYHDMIIRYIKERKLEVVLGATEDVLYASFMMGFAIVWPIALFYYIKGMFSAF